MYKFPTWLNVRGISEEQVTAHALQLTIDADIRSVGSKSKIGRGDPPS
jgi:hypothetical protein